jgi:hypothetical protein
MSAQSVANQRLLPSAVLAALIGAVLNSVVFFTATSALNLQLLAPNPQTNEIAPITIIMVIMASVIPAFVGTGLLWALGRFTSRPFTIFIVASVLFTLVSFGGPFSLPIEIGGKLTLSLMHIIEATSVVGVLSIRARA